MVPPHAPVAIGVVDRRDDPHHLHRDRRGVVLPGRVDRPLRAQLEAARFRRALPDRHLDRRRSVRRRRAARRRPAPRHQLHLVPHALEVEHPPTIARILIRRRLAQLRHEEGRRGERLDRLGDVVAGQPQPTIDRRERLVRKPARQPVRRVQHAHIDFRVGYAAQIRLQAQLAQRAPVDHRARHQRHGQNHPDRDGRHQSAVAVQPAHRNPQRRRPGSEDGAEQIRHQANFTAASLSAGAPACERRR